MSVSGKLGKDAVEKELLCHDNGGGKVIARVASTGNLPILQLMLMYFEDGYEILRDTFSRLAVIDAVARNGWESLTKHLLGVDDPGVSKNFSNGFYLLSLYFLDKFNPDDTNNFVKFISCVNVVNSSNWSNYIYEVCISEKKELREYHLNAIEYLFKHVNKLLESGNVIDLDLLIDETIRGLKWGIGDSNVLYEVMEQDDDIIVSRIVDEIFFHLKKTTDGNEYRPIICKKLSQRFLGINDQGVATDLPDGFILFSTVILPKFNKYELSVFVNLILSPFVEYTSDATRSSCIWNDFIDNDDCDRQIYIGYLGYEETILRMLCHLELQDCQLKLLVNQETNGNRPAILRLAKKIGNKVDYLPHLNVYAIFANHLFNEEDKQEVIEILSKLKEIQSGSISIFETLRLSKVPKILYRIGSRVIELVMRCFRRCYRLYRMSLQWEQQLF